MAFRAVSSLRRHLSWSPPTPLSVWWLRPIPVLLLWVLSGVIAAFLVSGSAYQLYWGTFKYVTFESTLLGIGAVCAIAIPVILQLRSSQTSTVGIWGRPLSEGEDRTLTLAFRILYGLTLFGYASWVVIGIVRGVTLSELGELFSEPTAAFDLRNRLRTVAGLTTMTQFGMGAMILGSLLYLKSRRLGLRLALIVLLAFAGLRAVFFSERLALLELAVVALVLFAWDKGTTSLSTWRRIRLVPIVVIPLVFFLFAGLESVRSWQYYRTRTDSNLLEFSAFRLTGYYLTAYNNAEIAREEGLPGPIPYQTIEFVWEFPGLEDLYPRLTGRDPARDWVRVLEERGNPEFNNSSGLIAPIVDYGVVGGLGVLALIGWVLGTLYVRFQRGEIAGVILYPLAFLGLVELPRIFYWTLGRAFPSVIALLTLAIIWNWEQSRRRAAR